MAKQCAFYRVPLFRTCAQSGGHLKYSLMIPDDDWLTKVRARLDTHFIKTPSVHASSFIADGAVVVGDVTLEAESSVWYQCTLRGDINRIHIGPQSNVQDNTVVHLADDYGVRIGQLVTIGHSAIIHACTIDDEVLVGMGATILDGAEIGARSIIGANSLVTGNTRIPPGSLVMGSPAKVVRSLDTEQQKSIHIWALKYVEVSRRFLERQQNGEHS